MPDEERAGGPLERLAEEGLEERPLHQPIASYTRHPLRQPFASYTREGDDRQFGVLPVLRGTMMPLFAFAGLGGHVMRLVAAV
jgi:hypothetical protein